MPLLKEKEYTVQDIFSLPDGQRAELIDGQIYDMAPPGTIHQRISAALHVDIAQYIRRNGGDSEAFAAPFAVMLSEDNRNYLEPDITVICDPDKITDRGCVGAPDWVIEIVSPWSRRRDYMIKLFKYESAGVREYWIVDPGKNQILVYSFEHEDMRNYTFSDTVQSDIWPDFSFDFGQIRF